MNSERVELHGQHIIQVITSLILKNGDLVQIHMSAPQHSDNNEAPRSILSSFVDLRHGDAVDIPPSHNTDDNVCKNGLYRHTLQYGQGNIKVSAACFLQNTLALASDNGDIVCVRTSSLSTFSTQDGIGPEVLEEYAIKSTVEKNQIGLSMITNLLFRGNNTTNKDDESRGASILSLTTLNDKNFLTCDEEGIFKVWNLRRRQAVEEVNICDMIKNAHDGDHEIVRIETAMMSLCHAEGSEYDDKRNYTTENSQLIALSVCCLVRYSSIEEHYEWHTILCHTHADSAVTCKILDYGDEYREIINRYTLLNMDVIDSLTAPNSYHLTMNWHPLAYLENNGGIPTCAPVFMTIHFDFSPQDGDLLQSCDVYDRPFNDVETQLQEDQILSAVLRADGMWLNRHESEENMQKCIYSVKVARLQRLLHGNRFPLSVIVTTLLMDFPVEIRAEEIFSQQQGGEANFNLVFHALLEACQRYAVELSQKAGDPDDSFIEDEENDDMCHYTDVAYMEFTRLCALRMHRETGKGASMREAFKHSAFLCEHFAQFNYRTTLCTENGYTLVLDPGNDAPFSFTNTIPNRTDVTMLFQECIEMVKESVIGSDIDTDRVALDLTIALHLQHSLDVSDTLYEAVNAQCIKIATKCANLLPEIHRRLKSALCNIDLLETLVCSPIESVAIDYSQHAGNTDTTNALACFVSEVACSRVKEQYAYYTTICIFLTLLSNNNGYRMGAGIQYQIKTKLLPLCIQHILHYGMLKWLDQVRLSDASDLRRVLDYNLYPSMGIAERGSSTLSNTRLTDLNDESSVFRNFFRSASIASACLYDDDGQSLSFTDIKQRIDSICSLQAPHSQLSLFLFHAGQFVCLSRWCAHKRYVQLSCIPQCLSLNNIEKEGVLKSLYESRCFAQSSTAKFYEILREQSLVLRAGAKYSMSMYDDSYYRISSVVDDLLKSMPIHTSYGVEIEQLASTICGNDNDTAMQRDLNRDETYIPSTSEQDLQALLNDLDEWYMSSISQLSESDKLGDVVNQVYCARDYYQNVLSNCTASHSILQLYASHTEGEGEGEEEVGEEIPGGIFTVRASDSVKAMILLYLCSITHIKDCLEMTKRARVLLNLKVGAELCLRVSYSLMLVIKRARNAHPVLYKYLREDLVISWERILNFALESDALHAALDAVIAIVELDYEVETEMGRPEGTGNTTRGSEPLSWQVAIRSLVTLACEKGELGFLCTLPDTIVCNKSICDLVALEMDKLAKSRSLVRGDMIDVNYYECLYAFHTYRGNHHKASICMHAYYKRLSSTDESTNHRMMASSQHQKGLSHTLAATLSSLCVSLKTSQYILTRDGNDSNNGKEWNETLYCVTIQDLICQFLQAHLCSHLPAHISLNNEDSESMTVKSILKSLGGHKPPSWQIVSAALDLAYRSYQRYHLSQQNDVTAPINMKREELLVEDLDTSIASFVLLCTQVNSYFESNSNRSQDDAHLQLMTELDRVCPYSFIPSPCGQAPWEYVVDILQHLDGPRFNWSLHRVALETLFQAYNKQQIPRPLLLNYANSASLDSLFTGKVIILIRQCYMSGHISEACRLSALALDASRSQLLSKRNGQSNDVHVPYDLLDKLLLSKNKVLAQFKATSNEDKAGIKELKIAGLELETALVRYMECQVVLSYSS